MGVADLAMFYIVTGVSLRWIATAAAAGPSSIIVWIGAFFGFYLPLVLAVVELSSRYPQEGGLYIWTRRAFGPTAGFMVGWSYFTSNLPYFPSVFYFDAANALYIGGDRFLHLHDSTLYFVSFSLIALLAITVLNIVGLRFGKWLHNIGAIGMWLPALLVILMGLVAWWRFGSATRFDASSMKLQLDLGHMLFWSSIAFALCGAEAASFMSGEIKDARRTIPRALIISGTVVMLTYLIGTVAVLLALSPAQVNPMQGLVQAGAMTSEKLGVTWLIAPLAILITVGNLGAASGFLAAASRIPFVIGIDRMLPPALGRIHPRWGTPHIAIATQGALGVFFVIFGQAGTGVKGAYDVLVSLGIIGVFIPFAFLFLSVIRLQRDPAGPEVTRLPGGKWVSVGAASIGFVTTCAGIILASLPAADEPNKTLAVAKIWGGTAVLLLVGYAVKLLGTRAATRAAAQPA
jgi:amino acid transporter